MTFVITGLNTGGAEMMLLNLLQRLDPRFSPHVISLSTLGDIGPRIQAMGIPVDALNMNPARPSPMAFFTLVGLLKSRKPDVVHTWLYHADLLGGLAARIAGVGAIGWCIRNGSIDRAKTKLLTRLVVRACARLSHWVPDRILSCSESARIEHIRYGYAADKMEVVPNGFDLKLFHPDSAVRAAVRTELGIEANAPLVGLIGRFDPQKNHLGFIKAAAALHRRLPNVHFLLAGNRIDQSNEHLVRAVEASSLRAATHLLGQRSDIPRLMAALDVLVSSSTAEGFPNVLGESMACGVPCVATDVGESAYIIGDTGISVPRDDMAALAAAIESILAMSITEQRALGERARARIAQTFDLDRVTKLYEAFYDGLVARFGLAIHDTR